jgi:hypothetical protein
LAERKGERRRLRRDTQLHTPSSSHNTPLPPPPPRRSAAEFAFAAFPVAACARFRLPSHHAASCVLVHRGLAVEVQCCPVVPLTRTWPVVRNNNINNNNKNVKTTKKKTITTTTTTTTKTNQA